MNYNKISYHAYNGNRSKVAIVPNAAAYFEIWNVVGTDIKNWTLDVQVKSEHTHVITCIDWAPITNRILTCAEDRNAFVWTPPSGSNKNWEPEIVLLRFEKAATCCAWSPNELKFAVGGAERSIGVCSYAEEEKWWVCKLIKKHTSSVLSLAWHPSNACLASSSCDSFALVNPALLALAKDPTSVDLPNFGKLKGIGGKDDPTFSYSTPGSWISSVAFSQSGNVFAAAGRNSTLVITNFAQRDGNNKPTTVVVNTRDLPHTSLLFADENTIVAAGFDPRPSLFLNEGGKWVFKKTLGVVESASAGPGAGFTSLASAARNRFISLDRTGQSAAAANTLELGKDHLNSITSLQAYVREGGKENGKVLQVSTSGLDGQILFWKVE